MSFGSVSLPAASVDDAARIAACKRDGCVACAQLALPGEPAPRCGTPEFHHILVGGLRVSHRVGICLGAYHHRGILPRGYTQAQAREEFGPTIMSSRAFHNRFGDDQQLLDRQDDAIGWPREVIERTKHRPERSRCLPGRKHFRGVA